MNDGSRQPKEYDLVLGGNNLPPTDGLVLGGIAGVKQRLASDDIKQQLTALSEALDYQQEGLDLVISALYSQSVIIKNQAYKLLQTRTETKIKNILAKCDFSPFLRCDGLYINLIDRTYYCHVLKFDKERTMTSQGISVPRKLLKEQNKRIFVNILNQYLYYPYNEYSIEYSLRDLNKIISRGNYKIQENNINCYLTSAKRDSYYSGVIYEDRIVLNLFGNRENNNNTNNQYKFFKE